MEIRDARKLLYTSMEQEKAKGNTVKLVNITKTRLYKYIVNFTAERTKILRWKNVIFFLFLLKI